MPLVSSIITTHNRLSLLPRAIESVLGQTYNDLECIVVDDASDDGTEEYCLNRKDIRYIRIPKSESKGGNHARNIGIEASLGEYIAFLDDDDYWLPQKIEKQVKVAVQKQSGFVYCHRLQETDDGVESHQNYPSPHSTMYVGDVRKAILQSCFCTSSTMLISKQLLTEVELFDESLRYWQEYELSMRIAQKTTFELINEALVVYRDVKSDSHRLTNNYQGWPETVQYILDKHNRLFTELTLREFVAFQKFVSQDASTRNVASGRTDLEKHNLRVLGICQVLLGLSYSWRMTLYYIPLIALYLPILIPLWRKRAVYIK